MQKKRGDELEQELRGWITIAFPLMQFAQHNYERFRAARRECHVEADRLAQVCHELQRAVEEG